GLGAVDAVVALPDEARPRSPDGAVRMKGSGRMSRTRLVAIAAALALGAGLGARAQASPLAPRVLTEEGRVYDTSGNPLAGTVALTFSIYTDATTPTALWAETQTITLDSGYFSVRLGEIAPLPDSLFDGTVRYLGVRVGTDSEMTPRQ